MQTNSQRQRKYRARKRQERIIFLITNLTTINNKLRRELFRLLKTQESQNGK